MVDPIDHIINTATGSEVYFKILGDVCIPVCNVVRRYTFTTADSAQAKTKHEYSEGR